MKRSVAEILIAISFLAPHVASSDAVGLLRRALTEAETVELIANMDCVDHTQRGNKISEGEALDIARQAVALSDTWSSADATFKATRDECGWDVLVVRPSSGPGEHRLVRINAQGKVLNYARGL